MGTVSYVDHLDPRPRWFEASYSLPGRPDEGGLALGSIGASSVLEDQAVVVRYDPHHPSVGQVVSVSPPHSRPNGLYGATVVSAAVAVSSWAWISTGYRRWRRAQEREQEIDHRADEWSGTTFSA